MQPVAVKIRTHSQRGLKEDQLESFLLTIGDLTSPNEFGSASGGLGIKQSASTDATRADERLRAGDALARMDLFSKQRGPAKVGWVAGRGSGSSLQQRRARNSGTLL